MGKTAIYAIPGTDLNMPGITKHCQGDCPHPTNGLMIVAGYPSYVCHQAKCPYPNVQEILPGASKSKGQQVVCRLVRA